MQVPDDDERSPQDRERAAEQRKKQATLNDVLEKAGESWRKQLRESSRAITSRAAACRARSPSSTGSATP